MVTKKVKTNHPYYRVFIWHLHAVSPHTWSCFRTVASTHFQSTQIVSDPEYRPRFDEQHRILSALRANTKLQSILEKNRENYSISETDNPLSKDLYAAFQVMCHLYNGFDNRLVSLKNPGDMNRNQQQNLSAKIVVAGKHLRWKNSSETICSIFWQIVKLIAHHFPLWFDKDIAIRIFLLRTHVLKNYWNNWTDTIKLMNQRYLPEPLVWLLTTAITQKQRFLNGFLLLKMNTKSTELWETRY